MNKIIFEFLSPIASITITHIWISMQMRGWCHPATFNTANYSFCYWGGVGNTTSLVLYVSNVLVNFQVKGKHKPNFPKCTFKLLCVIVSSQFKHIITVSFIYLFIYYPFISRCDENKLLHYKCAATRLTGKNKAEVDKVLFSFFRSPQYLMTWRKL